jgi:negative regulator of sigma E activity
MLSEHDEFLLSQLLDGDLPPADAELLQARIAREPELSKAFAQMRRLNGALLDGRTAQPQVDLASLHSEIMEAIEASRSPAIIRFPMWTRAAGLLAAAAAIVLFFTVYKPAGAPHVEAPIQIVQNPPSRAIPTIPLPEHATPAPAIAPTAVAMAPNPDIPSMNVRVRFNRPSPPRTNDIKISYVRSDSLATAMKARDTERQSRPTVSVVVAQRAKPRVGAVPSPFDAPL